MCYVKKYYPPTGYTKIVMVREQVLERGGCDVPPISGTSPTITLPGRYL